MARAPLDGPAATRLALWLDTVEQWRSRLNLTTVPREEAWQRHVEESLHLLDCARPGRGSSVVDLGSGAGIPGIVVAVCRPDLRVTLVESNQRKAAFLVHVCGLLDLSTTVLARRAEELGHDPLHRERHDLVVSRATAPPASLCELALPLLRVGGNLWALVADAEQAGATAAAAAEPVGGRVAAGDRGLLHVDKVADTPALLPRRRPPRRR